jgi:hypothetical protein
MALNCRFRLCKDNSSFYSLGNFVFDSRTKDQVVQVHNIIVVILKLEKDELSLHNLKRQFKAITGEAIPYQKLGYLSIEDFIHQNPKMCTAYNRQDGEIWIRKKPENYKQNVEELHRRNKRSINVEGSKSVLRHLSEDEKCEKVPKECSDKPKRPTNTYLYQKWVPKTPLVPFQEVQSEEGLIDMEENVAGS